MTANAATSVQLDFFGCRLDVLEGLFASFFGLGKRLSLSRTSDGLNAIDATPARRLHNKHYLFNFACPGFALRCANSFDREGNVAPQPVHAIAGTSSSEAAPRLPFLFFFFFC